MLSNRLRKLAANIIGGPNLVSSAKDIEFTVSSPGYRSFDATKSEIVAHAVERVPFYQQFRDHKFSELPVIDKNVMRSDLESFIDPRLRVEDLSTASTSGSTGVPFTAYFDQGKVLRHRAGLIGTYRFMGADPYGAFVHTRAWSDLDKKQRLSMYLKNHLPYAGLQQDSKTPRDVARWIKDRSNVTIVGYSSYIEDLLRAFEEQGLQFSANDVKAVIGSAEPASDYLALASQRIFEKPLRMRYSNMELGLIGVTGDDWSVYHIDTSSFFVEILEEDSNSPVASGQSGRIVVTDLHNRAMPFIRYDTGDLGQFQVDEAGTEQPHRLTGLKGRRLDVLIAGTKEAPEKLHSLQIWGPTSEITELRQFQLRQHDIGKFTWVINARKSEALEKRLRAILTDVVGHVDTCHFTYVDDVPVLASGKRQFFVNEFYSS